MLCWLLVTTALSAPSRNTRPPTTPWASSNTLNIDDAANLARDLAQLAVAQDPKIVLQRNIDLARAVATVSTEIADRALKGQLANADALANAAPLVLRRLCEELGATYVKLGQFVASSPTLFPPEYVHEFQKTLDATPPMPWSVVRPIIEEELGRSLSEVYSTVDEAPLAAASIAQVHAARLKTGEDVVIKVQRAGVQGSLRADLDLLYAAARSLEFANVVTSELSDVVGTLREAILEEIDFELEATRTEQFATFLGRTPELSGVVTVPRVYRAASAKRVLTLERLYGVPMTDLETVREYTDSPEQALIVALNTWITSVLTNEWFHADVHAGNLLMLTDGRVAFIDFGIVGNIPRKTADAMLDFVRAFPAGDMSGVAAALSNMGFTADLDEAKSAAFARDLQEVLDSIESMPVADMAAGVVDETQLNRAVAAVGRVASGYGIRFPREFALLIKQVLYFDRYTRLLAPGLDVMSDTRVTLNRPPTSATDAAVAPPMLVDEALGAVRTAEDVEVVDVEIVE